MGVHDCVWPVLLDQRRIMAWQRVYVDMLGDFAAYLNRYHGRTRVMLYSGTAFMIAAILFATAYQLPQVCAAHQDSF